MGQFGIETRKWLESAIKQRKMLIRNGYSHKPQHEVNSALSVLGSLLEVYSYREDRDMAKFIRNHIIEIETILPGEGSTNFEKKKRELHVINMKALSVIENTEALRTKLNLIKSTKSKQYEMDI